ncbi:ribonuclease H-like domain-containing protein [Tanacetum coccineum]
MGSPQFFFHDNKDARAINLDNELRSIKIGKMTVNEYCTKIQAMENRLKNLNCEVSEKNMVIFAVNDLDSRLATLAEIIRHREPLPMFKTVRNMLFLKESSFNDDSTSTTFESSSSSPTILMASSSPDTKGLNPRNNNQRTIVGQNNWGTSFGSSPNNQAYVWPIHVTFDENQFPYKSMTPSSPPSYQFLESTPSSPLLHHVTNTTNMGHTLPTPSLTTSGPPTTSYPPPDSIPPPASTTTSLAHSPRPNITTPISSNNEPTTTTSTNPAAHQSSSHHLTAQPQSTASIPNIDPTPAQTHTMVTRSQRGIIKPFERLSLHTSSVSPVLKSHFLALKYQNWCNAMYDEYNALVKNSTWIHKPRPNDANLVRYMWLFKHKFHADGTLSRYKARLVANDSSQQLGVDFDETFSPVEN